MKRLLDYDPLTKEAVYFEFADGVVSLHHHQDMTDIIEANKMMANDTQYTSDGIKNDWWHYARIPNNLIFKWKVEEGIDVFNKNHKKKVFQKLNDPMFKHLKVTNKKHA